MQDFLGQQYFRILGQSCLSGSRFGDPAAGSIKSGVAFTALRFVKHLEFSDFCSLKITVRNVKYEAFHCFGKEPFNLIAGEEKCRNPSCCAWNDRLPAGGKLTPLKLDFMTPTKQKLSWKGSRGRQSVQSPPFFIAAGGCSSCSCFVAPIL